ncbi:MAG: hypothetical protein H9533_04865 [Rhodobacteraceae bacterium]|nr:hypothetical protein [Paracoccaceae bacterium]
MSTFASTKLKAPPRRSFNSRDDVPVLAHGVLIYGEREERSQVGPGWSQRFDADSVFEISETDSLEQASVIAFSSTPLQLRNRSSIEEWVNKFLGRPVYMDITGLSHHVWMPILRVLVEGGFQTLCIYSEPEKYAANPHPKPGEFYSLSERVRGFFPIPSFSRLPSRSDRSPVLVPLLGFEGVRFRHLVDKLEPNEHDIVPFIGVPGFEVDYPFHTYEGNSEILSTSRSWQRAEYVDAACPFAVYSALDALRGSQPRRLLQLAAIGTKPHALGAMLFALNDGNCEILHDHPIRKKNRTVGTGKCHLYDVSGFFGFGQ